MIDKLADAIAHFRTLLVVPMVTRLIAKDKVTATGEGLSEILKVLVAWVQANKNLLECSSPWATHGGFYSS